MRFHCGISFSWRTIKKFLIPILLGVLAFFGFNFIYQNKDNIDLKPYLKAYALENDEELTNDDIPDEIQDNYNYWSYVLSQEENQAVETDHKSLFNKIYWFDDNNTELGVLTSIYELLLIYCLTMIFFRIITTLKNTRW